MDNTKTDSIMSYDSQRKMKKLHFSCLTPPQRIQRTNRLVSTALTWWRSNILLFHHPYYIFVRYCDLGSSYYIVDEMMCLSQTLREHHQRHLFDRKR